MSGVPLVLGSGKAEIGPDKAKAEIGPDKAKAALDNQYGLWR
jgi:hypothetical protein